MVNVLLLKYCNLWFGIFLRFGSLFGKCSFPCCDQRVAPLLSSDHTFGSVINGRS